MQFGYARVSAKDQHLDTQLDQLTAAGVDRLFQEKMCWNCLYLNQYLFQAPAAERQAVANAMPVRP